MGQKLHHNSSYEWDGFDGGRSACLFLELHQFAKVKYTSTGRYNQTDRGRRLIASP